MTSAKDFLVSLEPPMLRNEIQIQDEYATECNRRSPGCALAFGTGSRGYIYLSERSEHNGKTWGNPTNSWYSAAEQRVCVDPSPMVPGGLRIGGNGEVMVAGNLRLNEFPRPVPSQHSRPPLSNLDFDALIRSQECTYRLNSSPEIPSDIQIISLMLVRIAPMCQAKLRSICNALARQVASG